MVPTTMAASMSRPSKLGSGGKVKRRIGVLLSMLWTAVGQRVVLSTIPERSAACCTTSPSPAQPELDRYRALLHRLSWRQELTLPGSRVR